MVMCKKKGIVKYFVCIFVLFCYYWVLWQKFGGEVSISLMKLNQGHFVGIVASKGI